MLPDLDFLSITLSHILDRLPYVLIGIALHMGYKKYIKYKKNKDKILYKGFFKNDE